jgi:chromosome partitioning protein
MKTKIVCIASHKGGVGKTTSADTLGSLLSSKGERTLLVDLDAQRNLTSTFIGAQNKPQETLFDAFCGRCALPVVNVRQNLDIVPSALDMGALDTVIAGRIQREIILRQLLGPVVDKYEWILLDCPSQMGLVTVNAFTAANSLVVPISCDAYAAEGLLQLLDMADIVRNGLNPQLIFHGIVITRFHTRRTLDRMVETDLRDRYGPMVFPTKIRENATIVQAPVMSLDIISYDPKCNGALDYSALLEEIRDRVK